MGELERNQRLTTGALSLGFSRSPGGKTFLARQYASYPFHICRPSYLDPELPGLATLYIQSCAGGLYQDDRLTIEVVAEADSEAHLTTQASTIVHGMPAGYAEHEVRITARRGAYLEYLPDPQILFTHSSLCSKITVSSADSACVILSDSFLMHDQETGEHWRFSFLSQIAIEDDRGKPLVLDRVLFDAHSFAAHRIGVTGKFAAQATLMVIGRLPQADLLKTKLGEIDLAVSKGAIAVSSLPSSAGLIIRILADDGVALKFATNSAWQICRLMLKGAMPAPRRK